MIATTLTGWECVWGMLASIGVVVLTTVACRLLLWVAYRLEDPRPSHTTRTWIYDPELRRYVQPPEE
jgi:hypothetical protein